MIRNDYLIKRKFYSYLLPGVLMVVAMQLGNVVDSILVGNLLGSNALSAISLSIPVLMILQLIGFTLGIGGSIQASILLGNRNIKEASNTLSVCLISGVLFTLPFVVLAPFISDSLAQLLAGTEELANLLEPYLFVNFLGIPFLTVALEISYFMNIDNNPVLGSALFIIANIVNLVLDYILLVYTPLGMYGAAASTMIGYAVGLVVLIPYAKSKKRMLSFSLASYMSKKKLLGSVFKAGFPLATSMILITIKTLILNSFVVRVLGEEQMAIYSVCTSSVLIAELFIGGVIGLIQTIAGVLFGEKDYYGIRTLTSRVLKASTIIGILIIAFFILCPNIIANLFGIYDMSLLPLANTCIAIYSLSFIFYIFNKFIQTYYQTILQPKPATINIVLQYLVIIVPLTIVLLNVYEIRGVCIAAVLTEFLAFIIVWIYRIIAQKNGNLPQKGYLLIPESNDDNICDFTINTTDYGGADVSKKIYEYCTKNNIIEKDAKIICIGAEEIVSNISKYGYKNIKRSYIDICLSKVDNKLILRIRDDGVAFNPTEYNSEKEDELQFGGISLIKNIATNLSYLRILNMNNTIIELEI